MNIDKTDMVNTVYPMNQQEAVQPTKEDKDPIVNVEKVAEPNSTEPTDPTKGQNVDIKV